MSTENNGEPVDGLNEGDDTDAEAKSTETSHVGDEFKYR